MPASLPKTPYLTGIAGGSASGKTYFLHSLRRIFSEEEVCIISLDDYYRPIEEQQADEKGMLNFDRPEAIDMVQFLNDLEALRQGSVVRRMEYTFNRPGVEPRLKIFLPAPVIVAEGLFLFYFEEIKKRLDLKIYLDARDDIKLSRRLERDAGERGIDMETILYQWHQHVYPAYRRYLLPFRDEADVIITNNYSFDKGLELLTDHLQSVLKWKMNE